MTGRGWEFEADQRHAEMVVEMLGLENANSVATPGEDERGWEESDNRVALESEQSRISRENCAIQLSCSRQARYYVRSQRNMPMDGKAHAWRHEEDEAHGQVPSGKSSYNQQVRVARR